MILDELRSCLDEMSVTQEKNLSVVQVTALIMASRCVELIQQIQSHCIDEYKKIDANWKNYHSPVEAKSGYNSVYEIIDDFLRDYEKKKTRKITPEDFKGFKKVKATYKGKSRYWKNGEQYYLSYHPDRNTVSTPAGINPGYGSNSGVESSLGVWEVEDND